MALTTAQTNALLAILDKQNAIAAAKAVLATATATFNEVEGRYSAACEIVEAQRLEAQSAVNIEFTTERANAFAALNAAQNALAEIEG